MPEQPPYSSDVPSKAKVKVDGPLWLRMLVGSRVARRRDLRNLSTPSVLSLLWWRVGLTPTARFRMARFRESMLDDRGPTFSIRVARQSAPPRT